MNQNTNNNDEWEEPIELPLDIKEIYKNIEWKNCERCGAVFKAPWNLCNDCEHEELVNAQSTTH